MIGARRLNWMLNHLPRYRPDRRWNARLLQGLIEACQLCILDVIFHRQVYIRTIKTKAGPVAIRFTAPPFTPAGLYIHFHGGAWVMGNARLEDGLAKRMAQRHGILVAAVDFRNARDDRLERTLQQCISATEWLIDNLIDFNVDRVVIGGESSGAHLACEALLHLQRISKISHIAGFYSVCGGFNLGASGSLREASHRSLLIDGPATIANLRRLVPSLPDDRQRGPLHCDLTGLPPALFIAGALDPIVDDSIEMSAKWLRRNGNCSCIIVPEAPHGFNRFPTSLANKANEFAARWIKQAFDMARHAESSRNPYAQA
ncbi:alpha/beta hydrolase [Rhizobium tropici]|uniref:alpha/beta hydrolase n=1 Tax=Rhizobium tropici TaxID=398 RepID=UPI001FE00569|nr:alpha/beta hydrolase fold domain-containing protein [Rhizobium tropici]